MIGRGKFITLEGGEGAGKSTQARRLSEWLNRQGIDCLVTREPGGSPAAESIRELLLGGKVARFGPYAEALFFSVARADHVETTIAPALGAGRWVICDRFMDSTVAYQGAAGVPVADLQSLQELAVGGTRPDLTLLLDIPAALGVARAGKRGEAADRFERDGIPVHEARRSAFLEIVRREPERCVLIDADADEASVAQRIRSVVARRLLPAGPGHT